MAVPYRVDIYQPGNSGTLIESLDYASLGNFTYELNGMGVTSFTMAGDDPQAATVQASMPCEVKIWRGLDMLWWGCVIKARGDEKLVTFQCADLAWYFTRRYVGQPETNMITNGSFELGLEGWATGFDPSEPGDLRHTDNWDIDIATGIAIEGNQSLHIWGNDVIGSGAMLGQSFLWEPDVGTSPEGDTWSLVAWCYIPSATYVRPRIRQWGDDGRTGGLGLLLGRVSTVEFTTIFTPGIGEQTFGKGIEGINLAVDDRTPKDMWVRMEAPLSQPITGDPEYIQIQAFGPVGDIYWDNISLVRNERLYYNNVDQATIVNGLVTHAQDTAYGKSNLGILLDTPLTGVPRTRVYDFSNHELISDCIDEWPSLWNGVDWSIETTPTTRTFRTHYPRRGATKAALALVLGTNIASAELFIDNEGTANRIIVMADGGEGAGREEAEAVDGGALLNGLILERVFNATPGSAINSLTAQAIRGLQRWRESVKTLKLSTYPTVTMNMLGLLQPGDVVPVTLTYGWFNLSEEYRVMGMSVDPRTEVMTITLNPEVNWALDV